MSLPPEETKWDEEKGSTDEGEHLNTPCVIIQHPRHRLPSLTLAAAHFLGHLFLQLFQLFEEFASQIG